MFSRNAGENYHRIPARFTQLFWCGEGTGTAVFGRERVRVKPGMVFVYYPGEAHRIIPRSDALQCRWITFDGRQTRTMLKAFGLGRSQASVACPGKLFGRLENALQDATEWGERQASLIAYEILLVASSPLAQRLMPLGQERSVNEAREIIDARFNDADFNVSALASDIGLHRSTIYRLFRQRYGVSPIQYLARLRMNHALGLLKETSLTISEIAVRSGIGDAAYLSRIVKSTTGSGPREFRKL